VNTTSAHACAVGRRRSAAQGMFMVGKETGVDHSERIE
jgi:hypothetical protein